MWSYASAEDADEPRSKALAGVDRTLLRSSSRPPIRTISCSKVIKHHGDEVLKSYPVA